MPLTTLTYKSSEISLNVHETLPAELKINDHPIEYITLENGHFHTEYIPYQDFEDLIELAKYIIDYLPNLVFGDT